MAAVEPRTVAAFEAMSGPDELCTALASALDARDIATTAPTTIERATELSVELGGQLVSVLIGAPPGGPLERFLSVGQITFASGRLIGRRDEADRQRVADLLDEVLRLDLGIAEVRWMTPTDWRERSRG
ncbi:MAG: hypothetical protein AAFZ07_06640 [Actinomycetota bacterium]